MSIVFFFVFYLIGTVIGSMGLVQILLCLRCTMCYTDRLISKGLLAPEYRKTIQKSNYLTIGLWTTVSLAVTVLVVMFASKLSLIAYAAGILVSTLFGFGKTSPEKPGNYEDYIKSHMRYLQLSAIMQKDSSNIS